jgi:3-oxoacyl-[acyl-carrier-protein] synthase-1
MAAPVHVVGVGARTPVGLRAAAAAAAVRAGISRLGQHPFMTDQVGEPVAAATDPRLDPRFIGPMRFVALAETALREACEPLADMETLRLRVPLYLALPEIRPGFTREDAAAVRSGLLHLDGLPVEVSDVFVIQEGNAAGLVALTAALRQIELGAADACLIGGVDSYFQPDTVEWLDANRQLAGSVSRSGFVPGEGAGFCLLASEGLRARLWLTPLVRVVSAANGRETKLIKTSDICLGEGLTTTVREAAGEAQSRGESINTIICDINSERYRCEEWAFVCLRLPQFFDNPATYISPADCWGDLGAASGPLFVMLAAEAAARGFGTGPRTMIWASSEGGMRGAAVLETVRTGTRATAASRVVLTEH